MRPESVVRRRKKYTLKPGDALKNLFSKFGIRQKPHEGCMCKEIQAYMNNLGPEECLKRLDELVDKVSESIKEWKEGSVIIPTPPKFLIKLTINHAIFKSLASRVQ